jgi:hypothetical protein
LLVECVHKQITSTFGEWCTGVEMADMLRSEFQHRYNQRVSERRRLGFPRLGHYDTWLVDSVQLLVERNHGVLLYGEAPKGDVAVTRHIVVVKGGKSRCGMS